MPHSDTYYKLLGVSRCASLEDIKAAYQKLALKLHPDKASGDQQQFQLLQQAWQVLRDGPSRALYDHQLSQAELRATVVLHDEIELQDMEQQPAAPAGDTCSSAEPAEQQQYCYPCRCGDVYIMTESEVQLASQAVIIPCRSCSNHILVRLD